VACCNLQKGENKVETGAYSTSRLLPCTTSRINNLPGSSIRHSEATTYQLSIPASDRSSRLASALTAAHMQCVPRAVPGTCK